MDQRIVNGVGYFGMIMAFIMFGSYFDQIMLNWVGKTGSVWLPLATVVNCAAWTFYGLYKPDRDWKIALPNGLGVAVGIFTAWTAVYCVSSCA